MTYPTPRRVELRLLDTDRLTLLEYGRALAAANVRDGEAASLLSLAFRVNRDADPAGLERALTLTYAIVWQLERRTDPTLSWETAQTLDVVPIEATPAEIDAARIARQADELVASVSVGTGIPPDVAGQLTMSQVAATGHAVRPDGRRARRARVHR